jgi:hypothetical protein
MMRSAITLLLVATLLCVGSTATVSDLLMDCPAPPVRQSPPTNVRELYPSDIKAVMALGDSITAGCVYLGRVRLCCMGCFALFCVLVCCMGCFVGACVFVACYYVAFGALRVGVVCVSHGFLLWRSLPSSDGAPSFAMHTYPVEDRQDVYSIGGNPNATTLFNFIREYNPTVVGGPTEHTLPLDAAVYHHPYEWLNLMQDKIHLNAGVSSAKAADVTGQIRYLKERLPKEGVNMEEDWKLLTLFIGANDLCVVCDGNRDAQQPENWIQTVGRLGCGSVIWCVCCVRLSNSPSLSNPRSNSSSVSQSLCLSLCLSSLSGTHSLSSVSQSLCLSDCVSFFVVCLFL